MRRRLFLLISVSLLTLMAVQVVFPSYLSSAMASGLSRCATWRVEKNTSPNPVEDGNELYAGTAISANNAWAACEIIILKLQQGVTFYPSSSIGMSHSGAWCRVHLQLQTITVFLAFRPFRLMISGR